MHFSDMLISLFPAICVNFNKNRNYLLKFLFDQRSKIKIKDQRSKKRNNFKKFTIEYKVDCIWTLIISRFVQKLWPSSQRVQGIFLLFAFLGVDRGQRIEASGFPDHSVLLQQLTVNSGSAEALTHRVVSLVTIGHRPPWTL